ncbi:hypothetical protein ACLB2K_037316 [Fragaria x ananassa]
MLSNSVQLKPRRHSVSILEFGAVGDGKTLNTLAFQNAIFHLKSFADKGVHSFMCFLEMAYRKFQPDKPSHAIFGDGC